MLKGYIGLDVHKAQIVTGVAKREGDAVIHGKGSADIRVFMVVRPKSFAVRIKMGNGLNRK